MVEIRPRIILLVIGAPEKNLIIRDGQSRRFNRDSGRDSGRDSDG